MKSYKIFALLALVTLISCDENDAPEPQAYLTVEVDSGYPAFDMWFFTTDDTGKVLETHQASPGSTITFDNTSAPQSVNLTFFYATGSAEAGGERSFTTYGGLERDARLRLSPDKGGLSYFNEYVTPKGIAKIKIENCTPNAAFIASDGASLTSFNSTHQNSIEAPFNVTTEKSDILLTSFKSSVPAYSWVRNAVANDSYAVDFNGLEPFPKTVSFAVSGEMFAQLQAINTISNNRRYMMALNNYPSNSVTGASLGYLDIAGYDSYFLLVGKTKSLSTQFYYTNYKKIGSSLPAEVTLDTDKTFLVKNDLSDSFEFEYSSAYSYRMHSWSNYKTDHDIFWTAYMTSNNTPQIPEIPMEIKSKYPNVSLEKLSLRESAFTKFLDGYTYAQFVVDLMNGNKPTEREEYTHGYTQN